MNVPRPTQGPTAPAVSDAAVSAAKSKVGQPAKDTLAEVRSFVQRAKALLDAQWQLRQSATQQAKILADQQAQAELRNKPVTELRNMVGKGARLNTLSDAGFRSVADVAAIHPQRLQAVPGIGQRTAQQVAVAAQQLWAQVSAQTRFRFNPDRPAPAETPLLATLAAIPLADGVHASLDGPLRQFTGQTDPLLVAAERTGNKASMLLRGPKKRRAALTALAQLDAIFADPRVVSLRQQVDLQERAVDPRTYSPQQLWEDYRADAARFNALLSTLTGAGDDDTEAAQGYIPPELRQEISAVPLDTSLLKASTTLRGYQAFGAQYAIHQQHAIIGDEMGLGKTIEALATIAHLAANGQRRFLVVCPASVQINWINEIGNKTELTAYSLHGNDRDAATRRWLRQGGIGVTTFGTLGRLDGVTDSELAILIVDEAHYVKNPDASRSKTVAAAIRSAQRTLFLTGTPMENRVEEFRTLVGYLQPELASRIDATDAVAGAKRFRRAVARVYLRRNQEDVLTELPDLIQMEDWVQFTSGDNDTYASTVRSRNLMQMRQAAFHSPASAKLERLRDIVEEARDDERKVVVFSNFLGVLQTVGAALGTEVVGTITGSVSPTTRQEIVSRFTNCRGHAVLLSQIEAGGVGLNIQAASIVVITEPQWKPSTEEQAIARAHRMGQTRKVQVHRLLAKGSVDERLREVQEEKSLLFAEFARKSDAKDADSRAIDTKDLQQKSFNDGSVPPEQRIIMAEQHRLGIS